MIRKTRSGRVAAGAVWALAASGLVVAADLQFDRPTGADAKIAYDAERSVLVVSGGGTVRRFPVGGDPSEASAMTLASLESGARIVPGPRGGILLGVVSDEGGIRSITIHGIDGALRGRIAPTSPAFARTVLVGGPGRTLATVAEIAAPPGAVASWRWDLWSDRGTLLGSFTTAPGVKATFDASGERLLVLHRDGAELRDRRGDPSGVRIPGKFHKAATSNGGTVMLLGGDADRSALTIVDHGVIRRVDAGAPLHGVAVSPDGSSAWCWFQAGVVRAVDVRAGTLSAPVPPSSGDEVTSVTSFQAEDGGTAVVGFATRAREATRFNGGRIARIAHDRVVWHAAFPTADPTAFHPTAIAAGTTIVAWDQQHLAVLTPPAGGPR